MVTQDAAAAAAVVPKANKVKMKKMKKKKSKKNKIKGTENVDSESEADKIDLDEKVYPLSHYITDQEELVNQMFMAIRGSKLEAMLPPVLKSIPMKELKRLCLHELRGMSKKRILCCINGQVMEGSSGSEDEEEEKEDTFNQDSRRSDANTKGEKRKPGDTEDSDSYLHKKIKVEPGLEEGGGSEESKSVLELLELEMRARIIKTMLEKGDEGKKISEDAIAAVIESAKKITSEAVEAGGTSMEVTGSKTDSTNGMQRQDSEVVSGDEVMEETRRKRRRGRDRRRRHDGKRSSRSHRRDGSYSDDGSRGRSRRKKDSGGSKHQEQRVTKKKITRKEFEERMKRAKKNRTYRQRKSSEDEEKTKEDDKIESTKEEDKDEKTEDKTEKKSDLPVEGDTTAQEEEKNEKEMSEKEEGEIDSNEEEEGACSPSDITSDSRYSSSSRSSSRSWSRSYSRSPSRSPYRGRQRKIRSRRSRSRSKRRSYSRSYSRSRTPERRRGRSDYQDRSFERKKMSRESPKGNEKKDVKKPPPTDDTSPSREEDWGHKCDIEFVDSEEDFDETSDTTTKKDSEPPKSLPVNRIERASISFSLQKKPVGIAQSVDLDDLPLKKKDVSSGVDDEVEAIESDAKLTTTTTTTTTITRKEEIVISSDSDAEETRSKQKGVVKTDTGNKSDEMHQAGNNNNNNSNTKAGGMKGIDHSSSNESITTKSEARKLIKKSPDCDTQSEGTKKGLGGKSLSDNNKDTHPEQTSSSEGNVEMVKQSVASGDEGDSVDNVNESESLNKDCSTKDSEHVDDSESEGSDSNDSSDEAVESEKTDRTGRLTAESDDNVEPQSTVNYEGRDTDDDDDDLKKNTQGRGENVRDALKVDNDDDDDDDDEEKIMNKSESHETTDQSSGEEMEENIDNDHKESEIMRTSKESKQHKNLRGKKRKIGEVKKGEMLGVSEDKDSESDVKKRDSMYEDKTQDDDDDDNDKEDLSGKESFEDKNVVEPLRRETRSTQKEAKSSQKIEMIMRERLWMKRSRRKKEMAKEILEKEKAASMKSDQPPECSQSPSKESEMEAAETSQNMEPPVSVEHEEVSLGSPAGVVSDTDTSQAVEESTEGQKEDVEGVCDDEEHTTTRRLDQDTEIIGVIETSKDSTENFDDMELGGGSSWSMRWLQSEKVQKVVSSSKMLSRVRKKIQKKEKATKVVMAEKVEESQKPPDQTMSVIGSIEEYERLFGTKVNKKETEECPVPVETETSGNVQQIIQADVVEPKEVKGNPVFGSDDDGDDSDEDELWSKIIKK